MPEMPPSFDVAPDCKAWFEPKSWLPINDKVGQLWSKRKLVGDVGVGL